MTSVCPRHPEASAEGRCERCGDHLCVSCAVFGCEDAGCPYRTVEGGEAWNVAVPWEARRELGLLVAAAHTWRRATFDAWRFYAGLGEERPGALRYGSGIGGLGLALGLSRFAWDGEFPGLPLALGLLAAPFAAHLRLLVIATAGWVALTWSGRAPSWGQVARVSGYAASADLLLGLPAIGWTVVPFLAAGSRVLGFVRALGVPWSWAILAGLGPTVASGLLGLGAWAAMIWFTG